MSAKKNDFAAYKAERKSGSLLDKSAADTSQGFAGRGAESFRKWTDKLRDQNRRRSERADEREEEMGNF